MRKHIISLFSAFMIISLVLMPSQLTQSAAEGINIWLFSVFPSLFPFMVSANMLVMSGGAVFLGRLIAFPFEKLFKVSSKGAFAFISGIICGYPMGAKAAADLYRNGEISAEDAFLLLSFSMNAGPAFIMSAAACQILKYPPAGKIILFSTIISNVITGITVCRIYRTQEYSPKIFACESQNFSFSQIISQSVSSSVSSMLQLGGYIIFFSVLTDILSRLGVLRAISLLMPMESSAAQSLLTGMLEMTCGIKKTAEISAPINIKITLSAFIVSFGGFCVHFQAFDFVKDIPGSSLGGFSFFKLINGILSAVSAFLLSYFLL